MGRRRGNAYLGCFARLVIGGIVAAILYVVPYGIWLLTNSQLAEEQRAIYPTFWGIWWAGILVFLLIIYVGKTMLDTLL